MVPTTGFHIPIVWIMNTLKLNFNNFLFIEFISFSGFLILCFFLIFIDKITKIDFFGFCRNIIYYAMSLIFEEFASRLTFCDEFFHYGVYMGVYVSCVIRGELINITFIKNGIFYDCNFSADVLQGFVCVDRTDDILANADFENNALLPIAEDVGDLNIFGEVELPLLLWEDVRDVLQSYLPPVPINATELSLPSAIRRSARIAERKARRNNPIA